MSVIEGYPFTFVEVKTLTDGITVGGHRVSDQEHVLHLIAGSKRLQSLVKSGQFSLSDGVFQELAVVATGHPIELQGTAFNAAIAALAECPPLERALAFFLFADSLGAGAPTSLLMANGVLMAHDIDPISVPAAKAQEFAEEMGRFRQSKDGTEMMMFLVACQPA
jgi:hypothetical protein